MMRPRLAAALLGALAFAPSVPGALAADIPRTTPPPDHVDVEEPHRFSPITQGALGASAAATALVGVALLADSYVRYNVKLGGGDGNSCRPCSTSQLAGNRAELGLGIGLLSVGAILAVTSGVLAALDHRYRTEHSGTRVSRAQLTATGFRF